MNEVLIVLERRRRELWEQARHIANAAADAGRDFTPAEYAEWERLNDEMNRVDQRIRAVVVALRRQDPVPLLVVMTGD